MEKAVNSTNKPEEYTRMEPDKEIEVEEAEKKTTPEDTTEETMTPADEAENSTDTAEEIEETAEEGAQEAPAESTESEASEEAPVESAAPEASEEAPAESAVPEASGEAPAESRQPAETEPQPKKSHKGRLIGCLAAVVVLGAAGGAYVYQAQTYQDHFIGGTTINGIDVSELTVEEAEALVKAQAEDYSITVSFTKDRTESISAEDVGLTYVSDGSVAELMQSQNPYLWAGKWVGYKRGVSIDADCTFDMAKLTAAVEALPEFQEGNYTPSYDAYMQLGEDNQFTIVPESFGDQLDAEAVITELSEKIGDKAESAEFDENYYIQPTLMADDAQLNSDLEQVNTFMKNKITLTLHDGSEYLLDAEKLKGWLGEKEEDSSYYYITDEIVAEKVAETVAELAALEDCSYNSIEFQTTNKGTITESCDTYGCTLDQEAETAQLIADLQTGTEVARTPNYSVEYVSPITSTYVEVDITNQKVYMYKDGKLIVETSCVTGDDSDPEKRSDKGLFHVTRRVTDYTMRGRVDPSTGKPSYESFVNYAVFYNGGEALHDASWRSRFGGTIYKTNGSHGCINMPYAAAQKIYQNSFKGMTVIVH